MGVQFIHHRSVISYCELHAIENDIKLIVKYEHRGFLSSLTHASLISKQVLIYQRNAENGL